MGVETRKKTALAACARFFEDEIEEHVSFTCPLGKNGKPNMNQMDPPSVPRYRQLKRLEDMVKKALT